MNKYFNSGLLCFILFLMMTDRAELLGQVIFGVGTIGFLLISIAKLFK